VENEYRILVEKPETTIPLGRKRRRWADNIKIYLRMIGWGDMDWIDLSQDRHQWTAVVNTVMKLRVPKNIVKYLSSNTDNGYSRRAHLCGVSLTPLLREYHTIQRTLHFRSASEMSVDNLC
jgi:hypothetical protein